MCDVTQHHGEFDVVPGLSAFLVVRLSFQLEDDCLRAVLEDEVVKPWSVLLPLVFRCICNFRVFEVFDTSILKLRSSSSFSGPPT